VISLEPRTPHQPEKLRNCQRTIVVLLLLFLASITTLVLYLYLFSAECRSSTDACPEMVQSGFAPYTRHPRRTRLAQASIFEFPHQMRLFDSPPCGNVNGYRARSGVSRRDSRRRRLDWDSPNASFQRVTTTQIRALVRMTTGGRDSRGQECPRPTIYGQVQWRDFLEKM
jgi:hypothetical protein